MESTLAVAAATWAVAMALSPVFQIRKIRKFGTSRGISIVYFVVLLVGFVLWLAYGVAAANMALIIPNAVAAMVAGATITIAIRYRPRGRRARAGVEGGLRP